MGRTTRTLISLVSAVSLVAASPALSADDGSGGAGGASSTGDVFADLVIAWRDVDGVPLLTSFPVLGESGVMEEYCIQPVSYAPLPGLTADYTEINGVDGRTVHRIPLMGETLAAGEAAVEGELEVCDPQPEYAMYVAEAELERLNLARQPDEVRDRKLSEVEQRLLAAGDITLDGAGRITTDGVAIDAAPEQAALYDSLMTTGTIPGLGVTPAQVEGWDAWMLAAAAAGTAASKTVSLNADSIQYYNRIVEISAGYVASPDWTVDFLQTDPPNGELFVEYRNFSYTRADVYQGCATWLDVPELTWMVSPIADVVDFGELPPVTLGGTVTNVAGFTQLSDDVRATISYLHENEVIPGFFMDPVGQNSCDAQLSALTSPAVSWGGIPTDMIQTETISVDASVFMPWAGATVDPARIRMTIEATDPGEQFTFGTQMSAVATNGVGAGDPVTFTLDGDRLVGLWAPAGGFALEPGFNETTTFDMAVAAGAPTGTYELTLEVIDAGDAVLATDTAVTFVADAALTVLWTAASDFMSQGSFTPLTARIFNPDLGQLPLDDAELRITVDAPEALIDANQIAAWSEAVPVTFTLDAVTGDVTGAWPLTNPLPVPHDELITWYLNIAEGAPIGLYVITIDVVDQTGVLGTDVVEITVAPAATHGGGGGHDGGGDDGTLPPVTSITDGPEIVTNETSATLTFVADQADVDFTCSLDGGSALACSSPVTYEGLADGSHTFAVSAAGTTGKSGPTAIRTWAVDTVDPEVEIVTAPPLSTTETDASFTFTSNGAATVICSLDGAVLERCTSPIAYVDLDVGVHTFTVAAIDSAGNHASSTHRWTIDEGVVPMAVSMTPMRLADTRSPWTASDGEFVATGALTGGTIVEIPVAGRFGIPDDATAAVVNVVAVRPEADGYATAFPCGPQPVTASLNYRAGSVTANELIAGLSPTGTICVFTLATTDLVVDISGYVPADADFETMTPMRLADTRSPWTASDGEFVATGALTGGTIVEIPVAGRFGIPDDATAAVVNVVAVRPEADGYATAFPCGPQPVTASLNYRAGSVTANELIAGLSPTGTICVFTLATTDLVVDISGYVPADADFVSMTPMRLADTRSPWTASDGEFVATGALTGGTIVEIPVAGRFGIPDDATAAVVNVVAVRPEADGYATAFPCGPQPVTASLNYRAGSVTANELIAGLSPTGTICVFTLATTDLVVDITGFM